MSDRSPWIHYFLSGARSKAEQRRVREYVQLGQQQEPGNGSSGFVHPTQQLQGVGAVESTQQQHIRLLKLEKVMKAGSLVIDRSTMKKKGKDVTSKPRENASVRRGNEENTSAAEDSRRVGGLREATPLIQSLLPPTLSREEFLQQGWLQEAVALQKKEKLKEAQDFLPYNHAVNPKCRVSTFKRRPKLQEESYQERGGGGATAVHQKTKRGPVNVEAADAGRVATGKRMAQVRAWMLRQPKPEKGLLESNLHRLLVDRARKATTPTATTTTTMTDLTMTSTTDIEQSSGGGDARVHPSVGRRRSNNRYNNIDGSRTTDTSDSNNNQPQYYGDDDSESEEELPSPIRRFDDGDDVFSSTASDGGHGIVETTINNGDMKPPSSADAEGEEEEEEGDHYYQYSVTGPTRAIKTPQGGESNSRTHTTSRGGDRPHHANRLSLPTTPSGSSGGGSGGGAPKPPHAAGVPAGTSSLPGLKMSNIGGGGSINYSGGDVPNATLPGARSTQMERTLQTTVTSFMGGTFAAQQRAIEETLPNLELLRRVRAKHLLPWYHCCSLRPIWFAELCEGVLATIPLVEYPSPSKFSYGGENTNNQYELGGSPFVLGATFGKTSNTSMNATNATSGGDAQSQVLLSGTMGGNTTLGGTTKTAGGGGGNNLGQVVFNVGCVDVSNAYFYHTYEGHIGMSEFSAAMFDFFLRLSPIRGGTSSTSPLGGGGSSTSGDGILWIPHGRYIWVFTQILQRLYPGFNELQVIQLLAEWDAELQELHQERCLSDLIPRHWGLLHTERKEEKENAENAARCTYAHFALVLTLLLEPWCLAKEDGEGGDTRTTQQRQEGGKPVPDDMSAERRGSPTHLLVSVVFPAVLQSVQYPKMGKTKNLSNSNSSSPLPSLNVSAPLSATNGSSRYKADQPQPRAASTSLVELRKMLMTPQQQQHGTRLLPSHKGAPRSQSTEPQPVRTSSVAKARIGLPDVFFCRRRPQRQE